MDAVLEKEALEEQVEKLEESREDALAANASDVATEIASREVPEAAEHADAPGVSDEPQEAQEAGEAQEVQEAQEAQEAYESIEERQAADGLWWRSYKEPNKPLEDYSSREVGVFGEFLAARYLANHGYEVMAQNWRTKFGEVDIICRDEDGVTVLVEVKSRLVLSEERDAMPELAVDSKKQKQYRKLGLVYLMKHPDVDELRFDVMAINFIDRHAARLRHLVGAFDWDF